MDKLPVELLRLVCEYCDEVTVRNLREVTRALADVGYDYMLSPGFRALSWRNDIDRLHSIALHHRLRTAIKSCCIYMGELSYMDARRNSWYQHFALEPERREEILNDAWDKYDMMDRCRKAVGPLHLRADDLREACSALPNLKEIDVTFTQCPVDNQVLQEVFRVPNSRKLGEKTEVYKDLDAIISALHGIPLSSFKIDRLPLEVFRLPEHRRHWFTHAQSFDSLSTLHLTLDPSGLRGPGSMIRAVTGLGGLLRLAGQLRQLKIAFHPYPRGNSKFALSFRELLDGFVFTKLEDLILEGLSCEEEDLKDFLARHGSTLVRLRLGGRGLASPRDVSLGGIHLYEGTFKSLFRGLRAKLPQLQRLHLEGIFECEHADLPTHETYNFYPLTDEQWREVPCPSWVRTSRNTISCTPWEQYVLEGGAYPGGASPFAAQVF